MVLAVMRDPHVHGVRFLAPRELGLSGADSLNWATAFSPLNSHPASFWRQVCGPDPRDRLPHQLTLPGGASGRTRPGLLATAPSTMRAWPVVLEAGPRGQVCRAAEPRQLSKPGHPPAASGLCDFRIERDLCNFSSCCLSTAPVSLDEASKALTRVTGSSPVGEHASIF